MAVNPYTYLNLTGSVEGYSDVQANATVQVVPKYIEYMIDCNNNDSQTFKNLQAAGIKSMVIRLQIRRRQTTIPGVTWEAIMLITVKMHLIPMQLHGIRQVYSTL